MTRISIRYTFIAVFLFSISNTLFSNPYSPPETIEIAKIKDALTFARYKKGTDFITVAVTSYSNNKLQVIDLNNLFNRPSLDAIDLFNELGYETIANTIVRTNGEGFFKVDAESLITPIKLHKYNIATGTNYKAHAEETNVNKTPFLFSKRVLPTSAYSQIPLNTKALDWEVELAFVPLKDLQEDSQPVHMGLILSNDLSNREILMHNVDIKNIESGKGFAQGKSAPGLLPVGNLFIIPKNYRSFSQSIYLQLEVNDQPKQQAFTQQMIWDFDQILSEIWKAKYRKWEYKNKSIGLLEQTEIIPARTLILSGTPEGTAFQGVSTLTKLKGVTSWLASGFTNTLQYHVVNTYLEESTQLNRFLQAGDRVSIKANYLGVLENLIDKSSKQTNLQIGME